MHDHMCKKTTDKLAVNVWWLWMWHYSSTARCYSFQNDSEKGSVASVTRLVRPRVSSLHLLSILWLFHHSPFKNLLWRNFTRPVRQMAVSEAAANTKSFKMTPNDTGLWSIVSLINKREALLFDVRHLHTTQASKTSKRHMRQRTASVSWAQ